MRVYNIIHYTGEDLATLDFELVIHVCKDKDRKIVKKKLSVMHTKRFNTFSNRWVQFCAGAIPRLPVITITPL